MPSKKKKYNARFPAGRIKKIMQSDEEIGKVAQAVPVIITLELFVESLLSKTLKITKSRNAKTLTTSHMKQCIVQEQRFDFLRELVKNIPDINVAEEAANYNETDENGGQSSPDQEQEQYPDSDTPYDLSMPSTSTRRREAPDQNGGTHSMHLRSGPAQTPAPLQVSIDLTQEDDHRVHLKHAAPNSSSSSSVIMHTKRAIAAGSAINSDCKPPKLSRSESTPPAHQNKCRQQRLKPPLHSPSILPPASPHYNNNNISKFQPKQKPEQQSPPQTAAIIPAAPILSYGYRNKPIVNIDYSNVPMSVVAGASSATTAAPPLSAPANIASLAHATSAFQFDIAAPVINIDLSNLPVPSSRLSLPAANNGQLPFAPLSLSSSSSSNLLEPKATSSFYISSLISPIKSNNNKKDMGGPSSASKSLSFELDEDYDDI